MCRKASGFDSPSGPSRRFLGQYSIHSYLGRQCLPLVGTPSAFSTPFIPTSSSWLNLVERWHRDLTNHRLRREVLRSVSALIEAIQRYIEHHGDTDRGFAWTAKAEQIMEGREVRGGLPEDDARGREAEQSLGRYFCLNWTPAEMYGQKAARELPWPT